MQTAADSYGVANNWFRMEIVAGYTFAWRTPDKPSRKNAKQHTKPVGDNDCFLNKYGFV